MTPADRETQRLRELHELYVWQVNAAVEEGRDDLVAELAEEYLEVALHELTAGRGADLAMDTATGPADVTGEGTPVEPLGGASWDVVESVAHVPWWRRLRRR